MKSPTLPDFPADLERLLTIKSVRSVLGISQSGVYGLVRTGQLPAVKIGARQMISNRALTRFISNLPNVAEKAA